MSHHVSASALSVGKGGGVGSSSSGGGGGGSSSLSSSSTSSIASAVAQHHHSLHIQATLGGSGSGSSGSSGGASGSNAGGSSSNALPSSQPMTNGGSLEDSHANFFSLTDVCGIKWSIWSEPDALPSSTASPALVPESDAILESYARCLEAELLVVWRSLKKSDPFTSSYDDVGPPEPQKKKKKTKELWVFWYGEKPDDLLKRLLHPSLEVSSSGTWEEGGLPYEARIHLFKALNNLIERSLFRKDFVRLGKWFVQPHEGGHNRREAHLSFSFSYFVHGESSVCASLDVRQHPNVRKLSLHHLSLAKAHPLRVILAPYGLAATLTGVAHRANEAETQLQKWRLFYLLEKNKYFCLEPGGDLLPMPPAVEVSVAGVKLIYPTSYVLLTDIDHPLYETQQQQQHKTYRRPEDVSDSPLLPYEPSAYSASQHPLLHAEGSLAGRLIQETWLDGLRPPNNRPAPTGGAQSLSEFLSHWDLSHPGCLGKRKARSRSKEKSGRRLPINPKVPFHARLEPAEDLGWIMDQAEMMNNGRAALPNGSIRAPGSVKELSSPAGPKKTPGSTAIYEMSPAPNTPETEGKQQQPVTPLPPPPTYPGIPSPFTNAAIKSEPESTNPAPNSTSNAPTTSTPTTASNNSTASSAIKSSRFSSDSSVKPPSSLFHPSSKTESPTTTVISSLKRPALPIKDYEDDTEEMLSDSIYDYRSMRAWLNHPVKKSRLEGLVATPQPPASPGIKSDPDKPSPLPGSCPNQQQQQNSSASESNPEGPDNGIPNEEGGLLPDGQVAAFPQFDENGEPMDLNSSDDKNKPNEEDKKTWLTSDGLKPSINDLDNLFDDSSDEIEGSGLHPTPPHSNKSVIKEEDDPNGSSSGPKFTKGKAIDPTGNLPHDQLAKMFPTPPSHDHNPIASPADADHIDIKTETPGSPWIPGGPLQNPGGGSLSSELLHEDLLDFTTSTKFGPLKKLYSDELPALKVPPECIYKPSSSSATKSSTSGTNTNSSQHHPTQQQQHCQQQQSQTFRDGSHPPGTNAGTPSGPLTPSMKPGMSPISPLTSVEGPRSHHGIASSPVPSGYKKQSSSSSPEGKSNNVPPSSRDVILADSLVLNLLLSESLLNIFRDHNFDSCTMCVCSNEGNIKGRDASSYNYPEGDEELCNCNCGYSAIRNRRTAYQSGLFYEDESEVTSLTEDLYFRKKPSLLMLLNEYGANQTPANNSNNSNSNAVVNNTGGTTNTSNNPQPSPTVANTNGGGGSASASSNTSNNTNSSSSSASSSIVDSIPTSLLELLTKQVSFHPSCSFDSLLKYSEEYLKSSSAQSLHSISPVELNDGNDVIFLALNQVKSSGLLPSSSSSSSSSKLDESQRDSCLHKWTLVHAEGPYCSEDILRVMKSLQPILNETLHVRSKAGGSNKNLCVQGPLTWRQFHRMAGPSTKGNTDDQVEPLPVPSVTVGYEKDFLSISPLALHFWESLSLEPFAQPRDIAYIVVAPDNELILTSVKDFYRNLSSIYEMCHLGKHVPITHRLQDGVLKVGRSAAVKLADSDIEEWFRLIGDSHIAALLKLYAQVCRHFLLPHLNTIPLDRSLLRPEKVKEAEKSVMAPPSCLPGTAGEAGAPPKPPELPSESPEAAKESSPNEGDEPECGEAPAIVIYMVDPFTLGSEGCNLEASRLTALGLLRCFNQLLPSLNDSLKHNVYLQLVSLDNILELAASPSNSRMRSQLKGMAFSVYSMAQKPLTYTKDCKSLTGFGPASNTEKYLKAHEEKLRLVRQLRCPIFVLSPLEDASSVGERSSVLFCNYCLSEDQHWLLASCSDDRGELLKTVVINIEIPNKSRRKKASARRVGLGKLMDWILGIMALSLTSWRLVVGRLGRIGHGELRGWSVLLSRASLKKASKQLREMCSWTSDVPSILSACLVSLEPDSVLRVMADQFTPDERFGKAASNCQLSTPKDVSCTHILVFPTSATAQSTQEAFRDHQDVNSNEFEFDLPNLEDINSGDDGGMDINFGDLFEESYDNAMSPGSPGKRNSQPASPGGGKGDAFRYGQEEPGERIEILQQPLALGYLVSTAKTGVMPRWFWASCPHLETVCPVFLKSALHINITSIHSGVDDGLTPQTAASGRVHSLDSNYTTDVLRYVLEGYNALSWLSLDSTTRDRQSCLPIHVQVLTRMYGALASLL